MLKRLMILGAGLFISLVGVVSVSAHHGYAAYDETKVLSLKGTVTNYQEMNPHSTVSFDTKDEKGKVEHWIAEFGHVRMVRDEGWTPDTLKPGDEVTFYLHRAKNGELRGALVKVEFADGRIFWGFSSHK
ncbi:MAG: hypothetical protein LAO08_08085 [Acidobacteriia bacterium]|nr:hypothetical protein [Terriglobia bacterium]